MKLYATTKNNKGKVEGMGSDYCLLTELSYKNKIIGSIGLYTIWTGSGAKEIGYRVVWKSDDTEIIGKILKENVEYSQVEKGKRQKGDLIIGKCKHDWDNYGKCCDCGDFNII